MLKLNSPTLLPAKTLANVLRFSDSCNRIVFFLTKLILAKGLPESDAPQEFHQSRV